MFSIHDDDFEELFSKKRAELLNLLNKTEGIVKKLSDTGDFDPVSEDVGTQIEKTRQRCHEGLFSIALIAAFQSGKSTTLNAFADGREIAPRGLGGGGIKTSACLVKLQNPNEGEKETVKVTWKSHQDLLARLNEALETNARAISKELDEISKNRDEAETKDKMKYDQQYYAFLDFETVIGKTLLENALKIELSSYHNQGNKASSEARDMEDILRFAMLILAYHDHPQLRKLQERSNFKPEEMENYLKFPESFTERWEQCFKSYDDPIRQVQDTFSFNEAVYAFIHSVTFVVNSEHLKKSGAAIIDCPGLFASNYDTLIAREAMQESSAILFLLPANNQLSQSEINTLKLIKEIGTLEKVFIGFNYRTIKKDVQSEILSQLKKLGFNKSYQQNPLSFNAFLALRAIQGEKILNGSLDEYTQKQIQRDAKVLSGEDLNLNEAWLETTESVLHNILSRKERREINFDFLNDELVKIVREKSQWDLAINTIKDYVFITKAWLMLVFFGCQPIIETLKEAEVIFQINERNADVKREEAEQEWKEAEDKFKLFKQQSQEKLKAIISPDWEIVLADSFFKKVLLKSLEATGESAAPKVLEQTTIGKGFQDAWNRVANFFKEEKDKEELMKDKIIKIIKEELNKHLSEKTQGWLNSLKEGGNQEYVTMILPKIKLACEQLQQQWDSLELNYNSYLKGLDSIIPQFTGNIQRDLDKYSQEGIDSAGDQSLTEGYFSSLLAGGFVFGYLFLLDLIFPGLGMLLVTVAAAVITILSLFKSKEERIESITIKITEQLKESVTKESSSINLELRKNLEAIRNFYSRTIQHSFDKMSQQLQQRISSAKKQLELAQKDKKRLAEVAKEFRENEFEPLRQEMKQFQTSVEQIWPKP